MKKTIKFFAILAVLLFAASCQNTDIDNGQAIDNGSFTVTATIVAPDATRVTYDVDNETTHTITPAWTVGDAIIGFDDADHTFTFTVASVDGSGRATLDANGYVPGAATKLYAIYYPGKTVSDFTGTGASTKLAVDLTTQGGGALNDASPVLMCATADITAGGATLDFENQTAIIGVTKFKVADADATITQLNLNGAKALATFEISGGELVLTPKGDPATLQIAGSWTADGSGIVTTSLYFAAIPTASADLRLDAVSATKTYSNLSAIATSDLAAGRYYYMAKNLGECEAAIGKTAYATLAEAWTVANAATSPVTITLLGSCTAAGALTLDNSASGTGAVTLDLNGKTLSTASQIRVNNGRDFTITDNSTDVLASQGTISSSYSGGQAIYIDASLFTQLGGNINSTASDKYVLYLNGASTATLSAGSVTAQTYSAAYVGASAALTVDGTAQVTSVGRHGIYTAGTLNVKGSAQITAKASERYAISAALTSTTNITETPTIATTHSEGRAVYAGGNAVVNINGGTFVGNKSAAYGIISSNASTSTVTITDCYVNSPKPVAINSSGKLYVKGGCFSTCVKDVFTVDASSNVYVNALNTDNETNATYPFRITDDPELVRMTRSTENFKFAMLQAAAKAVKQSTADQTLKMQADAEIEETVEFGNSHKVSSCLVETTLDLNGHIISSSHQTLLKMADTLKMTITDTGSPKGKITSSESRVILIAAFPDTITISNCLIECTKTAATGDNEWRNDPVVFINTNAGDTKTVLNITDAQIVATKKVTTLSLVKGKTTITNSELSSGTTSAGYYAIVANFNSTNNALVINSGSFYSSGTGNPSALHSCSTSNRITIQDGYFYGNGRVISGSSGKITMNGGYFSHAPEASVLDYGTKTLSDCSVTYTPATVGTELTYVKHVTD